MIFTKISQAYTKFIVHSLAHQMTTRKSIDKVAKLLDWINISKKKIVGIVQKTFLENMKN